MGAASRWVLFSEVHGTVLKDGKPVQGAELVEKAAWSDDDAKNPVQRTVTDAKGEFHFPAMERKRGFLHGWLPTQPMVHQTMVISYQGVEHEGWVHGKDGFDQDTELDGKPLQFVCELTNKPEAVDDHYGICRPVQGTSDRVSSGETARGS